MTRRRIQVDTFIPDRKTFETYYDMGLDRSSSPAVAYGKQGTKFNISDWPDTVFVGKIVNDDGSKSTIYTVWHDYIPEIDGQLRNQKESAKHIYDHMLIHITEKIKILNKEAQNLEDRLAEFKQIQQRFA